jgi:hypothetical protein
MMLALGLFTAFLIIWTAPDTFVGKALRRGLVEWPAEKLSRLSRGQVIIGLALGLLLWATFVVLEREALIIISQALPDTLAFFAMFDVSAMVDVLVAAALISTQARLRAAMLRVRAALGGAARRLASRARRPRRRHAKGPRKPANDDDGPAWQVALAA